MSINIGNNNKIKNSTFTENMNIENEKKERFWKSVLINITSELLWKILGLIFSGGIITFIVYIFIK